MKQHSDFPNFYASLHFRASLIMSIERNSILQLQTFFRENLKKIRKLPKTNTLILSFMIYEQFSHPLRHCYNITILSSMNQARSIVWVGDSSDRRVVQIRQLLLHGLEQQSRNMINYYDFLLVAKKLNFRFQESLHLMELRKYFFAHKNMLNNKKLAGLLCVDEETLKETRADCLPNKIIIRFNVEGRIEAIKQATNEDEEFGQEDDEDKPVPYGLAASKTEINIDADDRPEGQEYQEKLTIILSIKVTEMLRKIKLLIEGKQDSQEDETISLLNIFDNISLTSIPYELFRKGIITLLKKLENQFNRARLTMSEEDIRAVFSILDENQTSEISKSAIPSLLDEINTARKITRFYEARVNRRMVKNTLFKLGRSNNSIQIYQVKNASLLEFKTMQQGLLERNKSKQKIGKSRIPHFGPIKGPGLRQSPSRQLVARELQRHNHTSLTTYKREANLDRQREKIEQIIRLTKQQKKRTSNDTIANKLRKLFIHKVILPRERLLEQQKLKYAQKRINSSQMVVKFL